MVSNQPSVLPNLQPDVDKSYVPPSCSNVTQPAAMSVAELSKYLQDIIVSGRDSAQPPVSSQTSFLPRTSNLQPKDDPVFVLPYVLASHPPVQPAAEIRNTMMFKNTMNKTDEKNIGKCYFL